MWVSLLLQQAFLKLKSLCYTLWLLSELVLLVVIYVHFTKQPNTKILLLPCTPLQNVPDFVDVELSVAAAAEVPVAFLKLMELLLLCRKIYFCFKTTPPS